MHFSHGVYMLQPSALSDKRGVAVGLSVTGFNVGSCDGLDVGSLSIGAGVTGAGVETIGLIVGSASSISGIISSVNGDTGRYSISYNSVVALTTVYSAVEQSTIAQLTVTDDE